MNDEPDSIVSAYDWLAYAIDAESITDKTECALIAKTYADIAQAEELRKIRMLLEQMVDNDRKMGLE